MSSAATRTTGCCASSGCGTSFPGCAAGPLRQTAAKYARIRFRAAEDFLTWISERGVRHAGVAQADVDDFYNSHKMHLRQAVRVFLIWAIDAGHVPRCEVPVLRFGRGPGLTQDVRIDLIRRFVVSGGLPLHLRAVTCLMLLYAQPLARGSSVSPPATSSAMTGASASGSGLRRSGPWRNPAPGPACRCCP